MLKYGGYEYEAILSTNDFVTEWKEPSIGKTKGTLTVQRKAMYKAELFSMSFMCPAKLVAFFGGWTIHKYVERESI